MGAKHRQDIEECVVCAEYVNGKAMAGHERRKKATSGGRRP